MVVKSRELLDKKVVCEDLTLGDVKSVMIDSDHWKVTHLEVLMSLR